MHVITQELRPPRISKIKQLDVLIDFTTIMLLSYDKNYDNRKEVVHTISWNN